MEAHFAHIVDTISAPGRKDIYTDPMVPADPFGQDCVVNKVRPTSGHTAAELKPTSTRYRPLTKFKITN